jgi:RimJ/RimL family protein N-acetyltransferase
MQPLVTPRLIVRRFCNTDVEPFVAMNRDPEVMRHFPDVLSEADSAAQLHRFERHHHEHGFGVLAVEAPGIAPFVGFVGLAHVSFDAPFTPCVEIAWRLAQPYWGRGFANEAAAALLNYTYSSLRLPAVVAFTACTNLRSIRVMERLHMHYAGEFEHPRLPEGHSLRTHVLYRRPAPGIAT